MIALLILLLAGPLTGNTTCVDLIELNHVVRGNCEAFAQYIFWSDYRSRGVHVVAYKINDRSIFCEQHGDLNSVIWHDGKRDQRVVSRNYRETFTDTDPERLDRTVLPEAERVGL